MNPRQTHQQRDGQDEGVDDPLQPLQVGDRPQGAQYPQRAQAGKLDAKSPIFVARALAREGKDPLKHDDEVQPVPRRSEVPCVYFVSKK